MHHSLISDLSIAFFVTVLMGIAPMALRAGPAPDDALPKPPPASQYDAMAARSPFSPPTAAPVAVATPPPPPAPAWSDALTVTGVMQSGSIYVATVAEANSTQRHLVRSDREEQESHLTLAGVRWDAASNQPVVTVRRGAGEYAQLRYEPAGAVASAPIPPGFNRPPPNAGGVQMPGAFRPPPAPNPLPPNPGVSLARPGANNVVRRPVIQAAPAPQPLRPGMAQPLPAKPAAAPGDDDDDE